MDKGWNVNDQSFNWTQNEGDNRWVGRRGTDAVILEPVILPPRREGWRRLWPGRERTRCKCMATVYLHREPDGSPNITILERSPVRALRKALQAVNRHEKQLVSQEIHTVEMEEEILEALVREDQL